MNSEAERFSRTHTCGELRREHIGQPVVLMGWVQRWRDLGGVIFIELRDRWGITQIVFDQNRQPQVHEQASRLRSEFVIAVHGKVTQRPQGTENPELATGEIDVAAERLELLNESKTPPFPIEDDATVTDTLRFKYRFLDLRRPGLQSQLLLRHRVSMAIRQYLDRHDFVEIETPMLTRSTPEGARDYLVPSRVNPGKFYALPQSPQIFKQLLMVAGYDRYYQVARCFRDEDLRADRQPEFTQIDIETSFLQRHEFFALIEGMVKEVFQQATGREIDTPFATMPYAEAMERFGVDSPDRRYGMELRDVSDIAAHTEVKAFKEQLENGGIVKCVAAPNCAGYSRRETDELAKFATEFGGLGLFWIKVTQAGVQSSFSKQATPEQLAAIAERTAGKPGDLILISADAPDTVAAVLGNVRKHMAQRLDLIPHDRLDFVWVVDFPLLQYDADENRYFAMHHPFTAPVEADAPLFTSAPGKIRAQAYDLILNGQEIGGGSQRIHQREVQNLMFHALGIGQDEAQEKFGFFLEALDYGAPPHGGIALGLDRLVAIIAGASSIRDVIAFPKTQKAIDLMMDAPSTVDPQQLQELNLRLR